MSNTTLSSQPRQVLEQILENALDAFVVIDSKSTVLAWTHRAQALLGWAVEEAVGRPLTELIIPPEFRQAHNAGMKRYLATGEKVVTGKHVEIMALHKDGHVFPVELSISEIEIEGRVIFSAALRDITQRKAIEEQLRATFSQAAVGIAHVARDGTLLRTNAKLCELLDYSSTELVGRTLQSLAHPDNQEDAQGPLAELQSGRADSASYEQRLLRRDGASVWVKTTASLMRSATGSEDYFILVFNDITQTHLLQERVKELVMVLEETPDFVGFANLKGEALYVNRAGRKLVGLPLDKELKGITIEEKYPAWAYSIVKEGIQVALKEGTWRGETALVSAAGQEIPTSQVIIAHKDHKGRPTYISTIIRDMTERHEIERALREADRRKDEFLAMLAHELRNPLAPISTAAQILKFKGLDESKVRQASEIITRQAQHMTELIDDLLDVSRVTRGLIQIETAATELSGVIADAIEQVRPLIEIRHHHLAIRPSPEQVLVQGDRTRLIQVVANLLNNAAKYTPEGGLITLEVEARDSSVEIHVRDNGSGIAPDVLPHIFELFTQSKRTPDRTQGGLGLGLALVKRLVELHGGSIEARSEGLGKGSEFTFRLPRLMGQSQDGPRETSGGMAQGKSEGSKMRLMVVDDNQDAASTLALLLETLGYEVLTAHDAPTALELARQQHPQVMLLDIGLPGMDGHELARLIRATPGLSQTVLIATTGYGQPQDLEKSRQHGFDEHLLKPLDIEQVSTLLDALKRQGRLDIAKA